MNLFTFRICLTVLNLVFMTFVPSPVLAGILFVCAMFAAADAFLLYWKAGRDGWDMLQERWLTFLLHGVLVGGAWYLGIIAFQVLLVLLLFLSFLLSLYSDLTPDSPDPDARADVPEDKAA